MADFFFVVLEGILSDILVFLVAQMEIPVFAPWAAATARTLRAQLSPGVAQHAVGLLGRARSKYLKNVCNEFISLLPKRKLGKGKFLAREGLV